jgi:hypothetical protein
MRKPKLGAGPRKTFARALGGSAKFSPVSGCFGFLQTCRQHLTSVPKMRYALRGAEVAADRDGRRQEMSYALCGAEVAADCDGRRQEVGYTHCGTEVAADCDGRRQEVGYTHCGTEVAADRNDRRQEVRYTLFEADFVDTVQTRFCWLSLGTLIFSGSHRLRRPEKVSVLRILIHSVPQEGLENARQGTLCNML